MSEPYESLWSRYKYFEGGPVMAPTETQLFEHEKRREVFRMKIDSKLSRMVRQVVQGWSTTQYRKFSRLIEKLMISARDISGECKAKAPMLVT